VETAGYEMDDKGPGDFSNDSRPTMSDVELMWRCLSCGELWPNDGKPLPDTCPSCGEPKTEFELLTED
jgi:rubrerythrin